MIDYKHKLIFIHVPRTAGTSILSAMGRDRHRDWRIAHAAWNIHKRDFPDLWESFTKFAVVRDPESRRRSWYEHHRHWLSAQWQPDHYRHYACSYLEWMRRGCPWHEDWSQCGITGSPLNQFAFIGPKEEGVRLLRFEYLADDWPALCGEMQWPHEWGKLPHLNASVDPLL